MIRFPLVFLLATAAGDALPHELWRGDFETGNLAQWDRLQRVAADRITVVRDPVTQGRWAARFEVRQGDNPLPPVHGHRASGDRAELVQRTMEDEGQERTYAWSTLFPVGFPAVLPSPADPYAFQLFAQWHQEAQTGSPPVYFQAFGDRIGLATNQRGSTGEYHGGPLHWQAPMDRGRWHHFRLTVHWSADPARGALELWHDGALALPRKAVATLIPGQRNYLKLGLYRSSAIQATGIVFQDGFHIQQQ
ncbi:MAG: hypothetical protein JWM80_5362 [Cyanobacteria bacterium RYN_339]|nr:hypothetical protein [Cyanobacteria bacterium RYN_339]